MFNPAINHSLKQTAAPQVAFYNQGHPTLGVLDIKWPAPFTSTNGLVTFVSAWPYVLSKMLMVDGRPDLAQQICQMNVPAVVDGAWNFEGISKAYEFAEQLYLTLPQHNVAEWEKHHQSAMQQAFFYKFAQNKDLLNILLSLKDINIFKADPSDSIAGIGITEEQAKMSLHQNGMIITAKWGKNREGLALMAVRDAIIAGGVPDWAYAPVTEAVAVPPAVEPLQPMAVLTVQPMAVLTVQPAVEHFEVPAVATVTPVVEQAPIQVTPVAVVAPAPVQFVVPTTPAVEIIPAQAAAPTPSNNILADMMMAQQAEPVGLSGGGFGPMAVAPIVPATMVQTSVQGVAPLGF